MNRERAVLVATVGLLLGVTFASGPLVGVSLTEPRSFAPGSGSVAASVAETPETATLERASHGGEVYYLRADPITVDVANVTGQPSLTYELAVSGLGHKSASVTFLDEGEEGTLRLAFDPSTLEADRVEAEQYDGVLRVIATDDAGRRVLAETNVTVEVEE
jgi:hypothetical protein